MADELWEGRPLLSRRRWNTAQVSVTATPGRPLSCEEGSTALHRGCVCVCVCEYVWRRGLYNRDARCCRSPWMTADTWKSLPIQTWHSRALSSLHSLHLTCSLTSCTSYVLCVCVCVCKKEFSVGQFFPPRENAWTNLTRRLWWAAWSRTNTNTKGHTEPTYTRGDPSVRFHVQDYWFLLSRTHNYTRTLIRTPTRAAAMECFLTSAVGMWLLHRRTYRPVWTCMKKNTNYV